MIKHLPGPLLLVVSLTSFPAHSIVVLTLETR